MELVIRRSISVTDISCRRMVLINSLFSSTTWMWPGCTSDENRLFEQKYTSRQNIRKEIGATYHSCIHTVYFIDIENLIKNATVRRNFRQEIVNWKKFAIFGTQSTLPSRNEVIFVPSKVCNMQWSQLTLI